MGHLPLKPWYYPLSLFGLLWLWWVKHTWWQVRLEVVCTLWQGCRHIRLQPRSRSKPSGEVTDLRTVIFNKKLRPKGPDAFGPGHLRAGPSGEERYIPQYTVSVSPQCPQGIVLLPPPPPVLQGTVISSEFFSQLPSGNIAVGLEVAVHESRYL